MLFFPQHFPILSKFNFQTAQMSYIFLIAVPSFEKHAMSFSDDADTAI